MDKYLKTFFENYIRPCLKTEYLPYAVLGAGCLGALLRFILFATGVDEKGLLVSGHAVRPLLWLLSVGIVALLVFATRDLKQAPKYSFNFPPSLFGTIGAAAAAVGLLISAIGTLRAYADSLSLFTGAMGLLSAVSLCFLASCRFRGLHPSALFAMVICTYLMANLICLYRQWSGNPQMEEYCFSLFSSVSAMLACYYSAGFAANTGNRHLHTLTHLICVYFCLLSLPKCENPIFYLSLTLWLFTDLCDLTPMPRNMR